jgi:glycosyltransferase involved in cell wall biosynthesis/GT2 family glycosyltransferase
MSLALLVSYSGAIGGAERVLLDHAQALDAELCLACPEGPLAAAARERGIRVLPLPERALDVRSSARRRFGSLALLAGHRRELCQLVSDLEPSIVIVNGMRSALALLTPRPPAGAPPIVFDHHDMLPGPLLGPLVRAAARRASLVVVPSRALALELGPRAGALVVYPGVEASRWLPSEQPAEPPQLLTLGAIVRVKSPELALEILARVRRRRPDVRLRLVGAPLGDDGPRLVARIAARATEPDLLGAVELPGAVSDPAGELQRATCLLHCCSQEGFGMVLVEALAAGRPVVAPAAAGPLEIIDESCGRLYPPGDADAAAAAVLELIEDRALAAKLGAAGRARALSEFSPQAARERLAAAVEELEDSRDESAVPRGGEGLALVTVTRNSATELEALLRSVARHLPGARAIVVDCASGDRTLEVARRDWSGIEVDTIGLDQNVGFGAASNIGVDAVREPVTALVNPDVELIDGSLAKLIEEAQRSQRLLAPLVLSPDGSRQDTAHPLPTSLADLVSSVVPPAAAPGRAGVWLAPWRAKEPRRVGWAVGCALVARTELFKALGPFDDRVFLYGEDLELGLRARAAGIETWFWPTARVLHVGGHSTAKAFAGEPFELLARARRAAVERGLGAHRARLDDRAQAVTFGSRIAFKRAMRRDVARERSQLAALRSLRRPS